MIVGRAIILTVLVRTFALSFLSMSASSTSHAIKHRLKAKDVFLTPVAVARKMITDIAHKDGEVWLDPFLGAGVFYNNYPSTVAKDYTEIAEGKDFFAYKGRVDVIVSNPPYSLLDEVFRKTTELKPRVFSYLLLHGAMTPKRMEALERAGYGLTAIHTCKVFAWYGMAEAYTFTLGAPSIAKITYDRVVHRLTAEEEATQKRLQEAEAKRS